MINGRKSGRSRGRRKICCGAAALASCLPLCLSAAEAEDFKEVHAPLTISGAAHNSVTALFAVQGNKQKTGSALLRGTLPEIGGTIENGSSYNSGGAYSLNQPYSIKEKSTFKNNAAAKNGGALYVGPKGCIIGGESLTFIGNHAALDGGAAYLESSNHQEVTLLAPVLFSRKTPARAAEALSTSQTEQSSQLQEARHSRAIRPGTGAEPSITPETSYSTPRAGTLPSKTTAPEGAPTISISARARLTPRSLPSQVRTASS